MKVKMNLNERLIIILSFCLLTFHTLTYLQNYYSYVVTLAVFTVIVLCGILNSNGMLRIGQQAGLVFLTIMVFVIIFIGYSIKRNTITDMLGAYLPYIIWPIVYLIVDSILDQKNKRRFLLLFLIVYTISIVATLSVVTVDNNAARLLAGAATDVEREDYYSQGVGGYGFVYGGVFLLYGFLLWMGKEKNAILRIILLAICITTFFMVIYASYTTALLLSIIMICMSFYTSSKNKNATLLFILFVILAVLLLNPILQIIFDMAEQLGVEWVEKRIAQIIEVEENGDIGGMRRYKLYMRSLDTFWNNIMLGGKNSGGHSMFLDRMALYGVFGLIFDISYFMWLNNMRRFTEKRVGLVYIMFIVLLCINTIDTIVMLPMVQFALPLMLSMLKENPEKFSC